MIFEQVSLLIRKVDQNFALGILAKHTELFSVASNGNILFVCLFVYLSGKLDEVPILLSL